MNIKQFDAIYSYDYRLDIVNIEIKDSYIYKESIDLEVGAYLDFDENYLPVNLEIIDASKRIGVEREFLINPSGNVKITIKNDLINVEVLFKDEGKNELLILNTSSETYIPNIETKFALV